MRVDAFDFTLPDEQIALRPARPRDAARLLHVRPEGPFEDRIVRDLPTLLRPGDVMVFNDTRVIHAALDGLRPARDAGGQDVAVHLNLHKRAGPDAWRAFAKPGKRLKPGDTLVFRAGLAATLVEKGEGGDVLVRFEASGAALDAAIAEAGVAPLPPYIADRRAPDEADDDDYQTVFAAKDGSVAAPTAGLHFTPALLDALDALGVERRFVTLHVGAGTFLPVKTDDAKDHAIHEEWREVSEDVAEALRRARAEGRRIIAVGTTALRTLESAVDEAGRIRAVAGDTDLFILPGFRFHVCDGLWTNFHLPRSTLFMLVCAFAGEARMKAAYAHAIAQGYRFYSYGDASLLWRGHG
ncbi:MAG: tRNA preQ1(34) S-adenosylmethionine ribosyltransferase-isomerase QueA [Alphaproteobacteria bacterium]|nr:tRNA preQ1(34) S-adenosylmethionine ribosyltransferase-isomerase QueA [Alphaproteobacteria bacterium]